MKAICTVLFTLMFGFSIAADTIPELKYIESESGKFGLADTKGNILVDTVYEDIVYVSLNQEFGEVMMMKDGNWKIINYKNEVVVDLSNYSSFSTRFQKGLLSVTDIKTGKSGYINRKGEKVIPFKFEMTYTFEENYDLAIASIDGKWGVIDLKGNWVVSPKYEHIYEIVSDNELIVLIDGVYYGVNLAGKILYEEEMGC